MADGQGNWLTRIPGRVLDSLSNMIQHPGRTLIRGGARVVGSLAGPAGTAIAGRLADNAVHSYGNNQLNDWMESSVRTGNEERDNQIFPPNATGQTPIAGARPAASTGSMGPSGGMAGITSPWTGQQSEQSPLLQMLGINTDYSGGGNTGPMTAPGGSTGVNLLNMIHSSSNRPITGASTSLAGNGATVGTATIGQVEDMLGAGIGRNDRASHMTQRREMSEYKDARRGQQRPQGMSVKDWLMQ